MQLLITQMQSFHVLRSVGQLLMQKDPPPPPPFHYECINQIVT